MTFYRVLVACDFSAGAAVAVQAARNFLAEGGEMRLVHVMPYPYASSEGALSMLSIDATFLAQAEVELEAMARANGATSVVRRGHAASEVALEAEDFGADLVVVGSRGLSRLKRLFLGSVARAIARRSPVSVLVARTAVAPGRGPIVVATDFYGPAAAAARTAREIAGDAELHLVHAIDRVLWAAAVPPVRGGPREEWIAENVKATLHAFNLDLLGGVASEHVLPGRPVTTILGALEGRVPTLLVVGTHGAGAFEHAVFGSVAERLAERARCDVLVVKEPRSAKPQDHDRRVVPQSVVKGAP